MDIWDYYTGQSSQGDIWDYYTGQSGQGTSEIITPSNQGTSEIITPDNLANGHLRLLHRTI